MIALLLTFVLGLVSGGFVLAILTAGSGCDECPRVEAVNAELVAEVRRLRGRLLAHGYSTIEGAE